MSCGLNKAGDRGRVSHKEKGISEMPIARSLDHMNMILERFAQREDRHLMFQHIQEFQEAGHLDDNCEYCLGMLRLVGGASDAELDHVRHVSKEIRERVRAAIVDGVKARCSVRFIIMPTNDTEETVAAEFLPMPPLNLDTMVITFNVPARKKITFNAPPERAWCQ